MRAWWPSLAALALFAAVPFVSQVWGGSYLESLAARAMILAIAAVSLDLLIGRGGMVSLGHAAFLGIGAYAAGIAITEGWESLPAILAVAVAASALFGVVTGAVALRTEGVAFIMITLAFGQMAFFTFAALSEYGGDDGTTLWSGAQALGVAVEGHVLYATILGTLVLAWAFVTRLSGSRFGRVLAAAKQNEERVETLGFGVFGIRLTAYVIAGVLAGVAGVLATLEAEFFSPAISAWQRSGDLIVIVVLGGMATRGGALIGAIALVALEEGLSSLTYDWRLIFGPLLILAALGAKRGLAGALEGRA